MITRIFEVLDTATINHFLVVRFEEFDKELCESLHIAPGFTIVNRISGRKVETFAGYRFSPDNPYESIKSQSCEIEEDGTINTFGLILSHTSDIKLLSDKINLESIREYWCDTTGIFIQKFIDVIEENDKANLRKCLYKSLQNHIVLVDIKLKEKVFEVTSTMDVKDMIVEYLWIPVKEIEKCDLENIEICPFKVKIILPEKLENDN